VGDEVGSQTDTGEKERGENIGDDLVNLLRCALAKMGRFADRDTDDEGAEYGMNARIFGKGGSKKSKREEEGSCRPASGPL
jgi:hypothetical protein